MRVSDLRNEGAVRGMSEQANGQRVLVTGGSGLVGSAVCRRLSASGFEVVAPSHSELDLLNADATKDALYSITPDIVVAAAAVVGGIAANMAEPVRFLVENTNMQNNLMLASAAAGVGHLVFMSSSCIYPRECRQPMHESSLLTGPFEPTNESYAVAKVAGMQLARALQQENRLRSTVLIPSNIYGPGDSYDPTRAHVASALVRKFVDATRAGNSQVVVWGTGKARRELMHSDDLGSATEFAIRNVDRVPFIVNVGTGIDHEIGEIAHMVGNLTGFDGTIAFDSSKPDGMPRKVLDTRALTGLGWTAQIGLEEGLAELVTAYEAIIDSGSRENASE